MVDDPRDESVFRPASESSLSFSTPRQPHAEKPLRNSSRQRKQKMRRYAAMAGVVVLVVGVVAAVVAAQTNLDLRQFAWGGISVNQGALSGQKLSDEQIARLSLEKSDAGVLFTQLTQTYFDADVANIDVPEFQVKGVVFKQYDPDLDQTLVFARLSNLPLLDAVPAMWLEESGTFLPAGVGEIVLENGEAVGYFMSSLEGDASVYNTLNFSYDASVQQSLPDSIYLSVEFDEPTQEGT